jgi:prepilin-type N-terminal cleavage/methylation domain-containing protein
MKCTFVSRDRGGLTLIELLVVLSIVGILTALLMVGVSSVRESGRRAACANNLRQISMGVESFHGAFHRFPPGQFKGEFGIGPDSTAWSWMARILPQVEQTALTEKGRIPQSTLRESGVVAESIPLFLCPGSATADESPRTDAGNLVGFPVGLSCYKAVSGANWGLDVDREFPTRWPNPGTNGSQDGLAHGDGLMWRSDYESNQAHQRIVDGSSQTFMIGEDIPEENDWVSWPYSNNAYGTCAIPPNVGPHTRPRVNPRLWYDSWSFRSRHPKGLQFACADGAVHFVAQSVDLEVYRALATINGREAGITAPW